MSPLPWRTRQVGMSTAALPATPRGPDTQCSMRWHLGALLA